MKKTPEFRPRAMFADKIRAMRPKAQLYFAGAKRDSLKSIACRIGASYKPKRVYYTQSEASGVIVYRET
jgi:hypothetical protein